LFLIVILKTLTFHKAM